MNIKELIKNGFSEQEIIDLVKKEISYNKNESIISNAREELVTAYVNYIELLRGKSFTSEEYKMATKDFNNDLMLIEDRIYNYKTREEEKAESFNINNNDDEEWLLTHHFK